MSQQSTPSSQQPGHDELAAMRRELATVHARLDRVTRRPARRRLFARFAPLGIVALLVALVPLATLAANPFTDLNPGSVHNANIDAIYNAGITTGCDPGVAYCPNGLVTREEMASFLARTAGLGANPPVANAKTALKLETAPVGATSYAANELGRIAFAEQLSDTFVGAGGTLDILTVTLEVPTQSYVHVSFSGNAVANGAAGCPCAMRGQLGVDGAGFTIVTNTNLATEAADLVGGFDRRPIAGSRVYLVAPGSHTFTVRLNRQTGTSATIGTSNLTLQAVLHPFGSTGATAAGFDTPADEDEGSDR